MLDDATYNPLGKKVSSFRPRHEIFLPGFINSSEPDKTLRIIEHATTTFVGVNPDNGNVETQLCDLSNPNHTAANGCPQSNIVEMDSPVVSTQWRTNALTTSVAADLEGNGIDEIVNIYVDDTSGDLKAQIITCTSGCEGNTLPGNPQDLFTGDGGVYGTQELTLRTGVGSLPTDGPIYYTANSISDRATRALDWFRAGIIAADVDGDGRDDIVSVALGQLDVFSFTPPDGTASNTFTFSHTPLSLPGTGVNSHMSIASGRFRQRSLGVDQERDDLVIAASDDDQPAWLYFYDAPISSISELNYTPIEEELRDLSFIDNVQRSYRHAFVTTGDVDNDGLDEIVVNAQIVNGDYGNASNYNYAFKVIVFDNWTNAGNSAYRHFQGINIHLGEGPMADQPRSATDYWSPAVKVFRPDGPGTDAVIYAGSSVLEGFANVVSAQGGSSATAGNSGGVKINGEGSANPIITTNLARTKGGCRSSSCNYDFYFQAPKTVAVADIYGTGQQAILAIWDGNSPNKGSEDNPTNLMRIVKDDAGKWVWEPIATGEYAIANTQQDGLLTAANIDHDSPVVEFVGHSLQFTNPQVIAVLASPPTFSSPLGNSGTTSMTTTTTDGSSSSNTFGTSSGFSVAYKSPDEALGVPIPSAGFKSSIEASLDHTATTSVATYSTIEYKSGVSDDFVVFMITPVDVYWYRSINADPIATPATLSINLPRKPVIRQQGRTTYNQIVPPELAIDSSILNHTIGDPTSYPTAHVCGNCTQPLVSGLVNLSAGDGGVANPGVGSTIGNGYGQTETLSLGFEQSVGYAGFEYTNSVGFTTGLTTEVSHSVDTSFMSNVTALPAGSSRGYSFGMFVYDDLASLPDNPFTVVNYWTENVNL